MEAIGVIPARWGSTRFEGKVLAPILGKPMIQYVWEQAKQAKSLDDLIIAADDERVMKVAQEFGGKVVFTARGHSTGTDRLTEIVNPLDVKFVVNIQADEPLLEPRMVDDLVYALKRDSNVSMATVIKKITNEDDITNPNVVKVVVDKNGGALYFSRLPIPYIRDDKGKKKIDLYYKHIGMYAYTKDFLFTYTNLPHSKLEEAEKLEQLRALEHGYKIKTVETKYETIGVDTPEDLETVKRIMEKRMKG